MNNMNYKNFVYYLFIKANLVTRNHAPWLSSDEMHA